MKSNDPDRIQSEKCSITESGVTFTATIDWSEMGCSLRPEYLIYEIIENECFFFIPDFYCDKEKLIIEVDGEIHDNTLEKDIHRDKILQNPGVFVLNVRNAELSDMDSVLSKIKKHFR